MKWSACFTLLIWPSLLYVLYRDNPRQALLSLFAPHRLLLLCVFRGRRTWLCWLYYRRHHESLRFCPRFVSYRVIIMWWIRPSLFVSLIIPLSRCPLKKFHSFETFSVVLSTSCCVLRRELFFVEVSLWTEVSSFPTKLSPSYEVLSTSCCFFV